MTFAISLIAAVMYGLSSARLSRALGDRLQPGNQLDAAGSASWPTGPSPANSPGSRRRTTLMLTTAALVLHGWVVFRQSGMPGSLSLPLFTSIAATTLAIVLLHIVLCLKQPADYLGIALYPIAAVSLLASQWSTGGTAVIGHAVQFHVFLSLLSYAVLALAAAQAMLVSIQRHFLSRHKPGGLIRALPPLDTTERLLFTLLTAGFILLSLSLASGFFYLEDMFHQRLVHKTVLSCTGWAVFAVLLFGRWKFGWRGKKAVHWTLAGFGILVLAYFGTKIIIEVILR
ncbi:MAG: cytochrome c biogenesis protein CcsA [Granulosicoccus sp.]|nr:cytochrome c biogenesis protein CcsA [Granulosicoccus sp.]